MTRRVTDFRVDTVEMAEAYFHRLPQPVIELFRAYAEFLPCQRPGMIRFELAIYRWEEIRAAMKEHRREGEL